MQTMATDSERRISRAATSSRFGGFKAETEKQIRNSHVQSDSVQELIFSKWKEFKGSARYDWEDYPKLVVLLNGIGATPKDVEMFSLALAQIEDEQGFYQKAGLFLSALVNTSHDMEFVIHTTHLKNPIDYLGYHNKKRLTIEGHAGGWAGGHMSKGAFIVNGNSGWFTCHDMESGYAEIQGNVGISSASRAAGGAIIIHGDASASSEHCFADDLRGGLVILKGSCKKDAGNNMAKGTLVIEGDVGSGLGCYMRGGMIISKGNAGRGVGSSMEGGKIYLLGTYDSLWSHSERRLHWTTGGSSWYASHNTKGMIFHNGEIVMANRWRRLSHFIGSLARKDIFDPMEQVRSMLEAARKEVWPE